MKNLIVANWKMNPATLREAKELFDSVKKGVENTKNVEIVICPPFIYIPTFQHFNNPTFKLGAQDCFWEEKGAFTGEISPLMLKDLGCEYVIIGHSERRNYLKETDEIINKKIKAAINAGLKPILCVGETEEEREKGKTSEVLKNQLEKDLKTILNLKSQILNLVVAYEPVWAIGNGCACGFSEAKTANLLIKKLIANDDIPILYGGSVNSQNSAGYIKESGFQGLLVGGASLDSQEFLKIVKSPV